MTYGLGDVMTKKLSKAAYGFHADNPAEIAEDWPTRPAAPADPGLTTSPAPAS